MPTKNNNNQYSPTYYQHAMLLYWKTKQVKVIVDKIMTSLINCLPLSQILGLAPVLMKSKPSQNFGVQSTATSSGSQTFFIAAQQWFQYTQ
eukprot:383398-Ditylum_brightwellii.AAC.1